jgi:2-aminoethylphosphonate-pyruvate transaminase
MCWCSTTAPTASAPQADQPDGPALHVLAFGEDEPVSPAALDAKLKADASITHVVLIHCETGAGVLNPLQAVADVCAAHGKGLIVDAMSSSPRCRSTRAPVRFDALIAASGKCLEGVPGMGFVFIRKAVLDGCAGQQPVAGHGPARPVRLHGEDRPVALHAAHACGGGAGRGIAQFVEEGGQPARLARYTANYETLVGGMAALGFKPFLDAGVQAPIIVTFHAPATRATTSSASTRRPRRAASCSIRASSRRSRPSASAASAPSARTRWSRPCTQWRWHAAGHGHASGAPAA